MTGGYREMVAKSKLAYIVLSVLAVVALTGCGASKDVEKKKDTPNYASEVKEKPIVTITMENDKKSSWNYIQK